MRKVRDAESTRTKVLESAERLFAEHGYNGTSLADISRECGISNGLMLYHFKSKEQLYREVLETISRRYSDVLKSLRTANLPPPDLMRESMKTISGFWKSDTAYNRISLWAYLENRNETAESEARMTAGLAAYISSLQEAGYLSKDIHPAVFLSMIIGPIHFWFRYRSRFSKILNLEKTDDELDDMFMKQFGSIMAGFLGDGPGNA